MDILEFSSPENRWLSNFYPCQIGYNFILFNSVENLYQARKSVDENDLLVFSTLSPAEAKKRGRKIKIREDWDKIKDVVMFDAVYRKFTQHKDLQEKLLATRGLLVESNTWGDTYWGVCKGIGQNKLGEILMRVRESLAPHLFLGKEYLGGIDT